MMVIWSFWSLTSSGGFSNVLFPLFFFIEDMLKLLFFGGVLCPTHLSMKEQNTFFKERKKVKMLKSNETSITN